MPAHHRPGLNDQESFPPSWPYPGEEDPEGAIGTGESGARTLDGVDGELLTQRQLDDRLVVSAPEERGEAPANDRRVEEQGSNPLTILREESAPYETDSETATRVPSTVGRRISGTGKLNYSGTDGY